MKKEFIIGLNNAYKLTLVHKDKDSYKLIKLDVYKNNANIIIPSIYKGRVINSIGRRLFKKYFYDYRLNHYKHIYKNIEIESLILPKSITLISQNIFHYYIKNLYYEGTLEEWCKIKFYEEFSSKLTHVYMKNSDDEYEEITTLEIPSNITSLDENLFCNFENLKIINVHKNIINIGKNVFINCSNIEKINVDNDNKRYKSIDNCLIDIKRDELILGCKNSIIPTNGCVRSISNAAFFGCTDLKNINIALSIERIGSYAFAYCTNLLSIIIPVCVERLGPDVFLGCKNLNKIYCERSESSLYDFRYLKNVDVIYGFNNVFSNEIFDYVIHSDLIYLTKYKGVAKILEIPSIIDGKKVVSIGSIFKTNIKLERITIPSSITRLENFAFYSCYNLTSIVIPLSIKCVGEFVFSLFGNLKSIYYARNLNSIYYEGNIDEFKNIKIYDLSGIVLKDNILDNEYNKVKFIDNKTIIYFYSELKPNDNNCKYWHYVDDIITVWE